MTIAKCFKCGGRAIADTFEQARKLINHAVGLSRGIKCGDSYNHVKEIKPEGITNKPETPKQVTSKPVIPDKPIPEEKPKPEKPKPIIETPKTEPQKTTTPEKIKTKDNKTNRK